VAVGLGLVPFVADSPCEAETIYHCARVVKDPERAAGRTLVLDDLQHSYVGRDLPRGVRVECSWLGGPEGSSADERRRGRRPPALTAR